MRNGAADKVVSTTVAAAADSPDSEDQTHRTVLGRLNAILGALDSRDRVLSLSEISHQVDLPRSTVHRLVEQLCRYGWLEKKSGGYRIGMKLFEIGGIALQRNGLREASFRPIYALAAKTGLAAQLAILDGDEVVYLERIVMTPFGLPTRVGGRQPAYCTALGKAILAFEDENQQDAVCAHMPRRTDFTITDAKAMKAELRQIRQVGVAYDRQESYNGLVCAAAPVRKSGRAIGAVSVTGPASRMQLGSAARDVLDTAVALWEGRLMARASLANVRAV